MRSSQGAADSAVAFGRRYHFNPLEKAAFDGRAANMGPPRRIVIWNHPPDRRNQALQDAGSTIMDVLRKSIRGQLRFVQADRDSTLALLARTRSRDSVAHALNADMMATIRGTPASGDSVTWILQVWDLTAHSAFSSRIVTAGKVALSDPLASVDSLTARAFHALQEIDRAPRKGFDPMRVPAPPTPARAEPPAPTKP